MSNINPLIPDESERPPSVHFAFVIDGEVVWFQSIDPRLERAVAVFRSEPVIIEITEEQKKTIGLGWTYDGLKFSEPE